MRLPRTPQSVAGQSWAHNDMWSRRECRWRIWCTFARHAMTWLPHTYIYLYVLHKFCWTLKNIARTCLCSHILYYTCKICTPAGGVRRCWRSVNVFSACLPVMTTWWGPKYTLTVANTCIYIYIYICTRRVAVRYWLVIEESVIRRVGLSNLYI